MSSSKPKKPDVSENPTDEWAKFNVRVGSAPKKFRKYAELKAKQVPKSDTN